MFCHDKRNRLQRVTSATVTTPSQPNGNQFRQLIDVVQHVGQRLYPLDKNRKAFAQLLIIRISRYEDMLKNSEKFIRKSERVFITYKDTH